MPVRDRKWYLDILARYHAKVNHPAYGDIRKRGNPPSVIKAVAILRGSKACRVCRTLDHVELHHVDGRWKNYTLKNLQFYCHRCHNQTHKEIQMRNPRTKWTNDLVKALRNDVNVLVSKGSTKKAAYEKLRTKWKIGPDYMAGLCNRGLDALRVSARKYDKRHLKSQQVRTNGAGPGVSTTTMTAAEAIQFYNFLKRMNITIA